VVGAFAFPPALVHVPLEARLRSRPGWGFGAVGAGSLLIGGAHLLYWVLGGFSDIQALEVAAGGLALGALCVIVQLLRLLKPITLALGPEQRIGVYVGGQLMRSIVRGDIVWYRLSIVNTLREFLAFGMVGVGGLIAAVVYLAGASDANIGYLLPIAWTITAAIACIGLLGNSVWTRAMARHYFVQGGGKRYTVVFQKTDLRRLGWLQ
jgi:hypothetical protein